MVTAQLFVLNNIQQPIQCRALLDTCSTTNFMTEALANRLQTKKTTCNVAIGALNSTTTFSKELTTATIRSRINNYEKTLTFLIVQKISESIPDQTINRELIKIPSNIKLADTEFHKPAPVDILLGAGPSLSSFAVGQIQLSLPTKQDLYLQKTLFGWIIGGAAPSTRSTSRRTSHLTVPLQFELSKFWEIEECPSVNSYTSEEEACEQHFKKYVTRTEEGRYVVALPFNDRIKKLGESYTQAKKRFENTEKRLNSNPEFKKQYNDVLNEYLNLGHMTLCTDHSTTSAGFYLPHHAVIKETSMTTKVRVVFDGSAKTTTGVSLNDTLFVGPTIQSDLFSLLIRFRQHPIVLTGDIEKMYRQFYIRQEDRKFQRIIWANNIYTLNTVTFGIASAPYLAIRCLHQLAEDEGSNYQLAAPILKEDFYVDDVLTGANNPEEATRIRIELTELLIKAGLSIRQWASNDATVLQGIPQTSINKHLQLGDTNTLKTLGICWNAINDVITYSVNPSTINKFTKRNILAETAKIFDPLGLLSPVIIIAKIILQKLWTIKVDWDEPLPISLHTEWLQYYHELKILNNISFPRTIVTSNIQDFQMHGFADASQKAYGACIYLRTVDNENKIKTFLLCAKSRVAPLKTTTIPRLELCAAQLLATLTTAVVTALKLKINKIFYWTDSSIVIHWLKHDPNQLKTFVSNRVADIQSKTNSNHWYHVRTHDNPADIVSRGNTPKKFIESTIWRFGPPWLSKPIDHWPRSEITTLNEIPEKRKSTCLATLSTSLPDDIFNRFSTFNRLIRVLTYCYRFIHRTKVKGLLTVKELQCTLNRIITSIQQQAFPVEIKHLTAKNPSKINHCQLNKLNTFLDQEGIIRVGGRLTHSNLSYDAKHPIVLPKNNHVTRLIIENEHRIHLHSGVQQTLYAIRRKYWPIDGKGQVWKVLKQCVACSKSNPPQTNYLMGNLPSSRVSPSRPFSKIGIDYCGPFILKEKKFRNKTKIKSYVAVFVCLSTKAIHLELVTDLTTEGFLSALRRFISRRGPCEDIYSDNATNFVGANNSLKELYYTVHKPKNNEKIQGYLTTKNIQWHFIPPHAPHVGGLWEAAVRSFKKHLKHVVGRELIFTYEEFNTLIIEIEAILNSRPLTPISSDPNDPLTLTPGHFLIGDSLTNLRSQNYDNVPSNRLSTWQHIQKVKQHFWSRWSREYLNELTTRTKWNKSSPNITTGAIVLLRDDNLSPAQWSMGRVIKCFPGDDGVVRTVEIKTANTT